MKDIIVVATSPGRENWTREILESISRPVVVVSDFGYELGKIRWVFENTNCDRFLFLQDSLVVRDESLFAQVFEVPGSSCIMDVPSCLGSYMGVYERSVLAQLEIPLVSSKEESIRFEMEWTKEYISLCENFSHPLNIKHKEFETVRKFGRENLLYVNQYYEKWKGDWGFPVENADTYVNPISLERVNLQMIEKSRLIQNLIGENAVLTQKVHQPSPLLIEPNEIAQWNKLLESNNQAIKFLHDAQQEVLSAVRNSNALNELTHENILLNHRNQALNSSLDAQQESLTAIHNSTTWRMFSFYRWIKNHLRNTDQ